MSIIKSILDTDIYKLTMGQAVAQKFPHAHAKYKFINRGGTKFPNYIGPAIRDEIDKMANLKLSNIEQSWLGWSCSFFTPVYLDFLKGYRYNPNEVYVSCKDGDLEVLIEGPWYRTILWEVKLMAIISELYNRDSKQPTIDDVFSAHDKIYTLNKKGCKVADFGTRRRFHQQHQDSVVKTCSKIPGFVGTSNVYLAMKHGVKSIGTQGHEWIMFHGAKYGYREANRIALKNWVDVYHGNLGIALTDTFGTNDFFKAFGSKYSKLFDGVRHDSGDPFKFAGQVFKHYTNLGIDPSSKTIVFSDGLNIKKALELQKLCNNINIKCSFGIGTNLTNDIEGVIPLNMVIKMTHCKPYGESEWLPVVKLSDDEGKHTGDPEEIKLCQKTVRNY